MNVLQSLSKKLAYVAENKESKDSLAMQDVVPEFERLRIKAVYKVLFDVMLVFWIHLSFTCGQIRFICMKVRCFYASNV